jgi:hypothetical protein
MAMSATPRTAAQDAPSKTYAYPPTEIFKIVMHVDGTVLDVEIPEGAESLGECPDAKITEVISTIQYARANCPACPKPKGCFCLPGSPQRCWCL